MADLTSKTTTTAQGSQTPVTSNKTEGWPSAPNPDPNQWTPLDFAAQGDTENIVGKGVPHKAAFVLGDGVPD